MISQVCEEFHCLPNDAIRAINEDEGGLLFTILEFRTYARAKQIYDTTPMEKRPKTAAMEQVSEIVFGLAHERIKKAQEATAKAKKSDG